jgi:hypothetical protein
LGFRKKKTFEKLIWNFRKQNFLKFELSLRKKHQPLGVEETKLCKLILGT